MRRRSVVAVCALAAVFAASAGAEAEPQRRQYVAGYGLVRVGGSGTLPAGVGGVTFAAQPVRPRTVVVNDAVGTKVFVSLCQDISGDGLCAETEPNYAACLTRGAARTIPAAANFVPGYPTTAFVYAADDVAKLYPYLPHEPCPDALGTTGSIDLS